MKIAATVARLLLGAIFVFFGSDLFLNFLHPAMPTGTAGQFLGALFVSHYFYAIGFFEVVGGLLLLINRFVPLGLIVLAPLIVGIFLVHALMAPSGLPLATLVTVLWLLAAYRVRSAFAGLLQERVED